MRIAMVSEHASPLAVLGGVDAGGQNVHVAALAGELVRRGHQVTVFTRRDAPALPDRVAAPDGYVVEHVDAGPPAEVPKDELLGHMRQFAADLLPRLEAGRFDLVHSHFWMSGLATRWALEASEPLPHLHTFHALGVVKKRHQGADDTSPAERVARERWLAGEVDQVVATSREEVDELAAEGLARERCTVVPCGVDTDRFAPGTGTGATLAPVEDPGAPPRLLCLGRLVPRKGVADVVAALPELPGVELLVAGGPPADSLGMDEEVRRLERMATNLRVRDRVRFLGRVDHDAIPALLSAADVVVSVPWYEPFGIVPVEAMACGRPLVASEVGGQRDTVVDAHTGVLVPPRHPQRVATAVYDLLRDPPTRERMGRAGRSRAVEQYDWRRVAELTEAAYAEAVARRRSREVLR